MSSMQGKVFLGRYRVVRVLGEGGMGKAYLCKQVDLNREIVIKVMHDHVASDTRFQQFFLQEMQAMAAFQHPYAVSLFDAYLDTPDGPCILMEYIKGKPLDMVLKENRRFSPQRVSRILSQICEVLQAAHAVGIVHRDLKPSNLMIMDADTQYEKVKVMDFGLAKLTAGRSLKDEASAPSARDMMLGTPAYVSPEQARGEEVDHRSDLYSLGVIIYELITGRLPFDGMSSMDTMLAHAIDPPPPMSTEDYWVAPSIERFVNWVMAKQPSDRPQNARELMNGFMDALAAMDYEEPTEHPIAHEELVLQQAGPPPVPEVVDPALMVFQLQAWMPHAVAAYKLNGYISDARGELIESSPGRIRVYLGGKGMAYGSLKPQGWFRRGPGKPDIELELQLYESNDPKQASHVWITVYLRYIGKNLDAEWRERAEQIYRDLRGYLIGSVGD